MTSPQARSRSGASNRRRRPGSTQPRSTAPRQPRAGPTRTGPHPRSCGPRPRRACPRSPSSACPNRSCGRWRPRASPSRSRSRRRPSPTRSPAATCSAAARPARARHSRSGCPCWPASRATGRARADPAGWSWCPPASSPSRSSTRSCRSPGARAVGRPPSSAACLRPPVHELQRGVDVLVATPGRLRRPPRPGHLRARRRHDHRDRRGRPDGRHGLPAGGPAHPRPTPSDGQRLLFSATLDGDVRTLVQRYLPIR